MIKRPFTQYSALRILFLASAISLASTECLSSEPLEHVSGLVAAGHDSRIDLRWEPVAPFGSAAYDVYRADRTGGSFRKINTRPHKGFIYSDFLGENDRTFYYRVVPAGQKPAGPAVSAASRAMTDEELLTSLQEAIFRYYWDYAHPACGLSFGRIPVRSIRSENVVAVGGAAFGLMCYMPAVERGFITRDQAAERLLTAVRFLQEKADRFHGAWPHWLNGDTGKTVPFSTYDDGADIVETSFMIQSLLALRQYFDADTPTEKELRERITQLWRDVEWNFFLQDPDDKGLTWHWSPTYGFYKDHRITGFNECMITYLLAIASPTHPIPPDCYYKGWANNPDYANPNSYYGIPQLVGPPNGGALFMTQYSFLGFDPRGKRDRFCNYFDAARAISRINRAYCIENPQGFKGYSELVWGLTSSDAPGGRYHGSRPNAERDRGIIAPTAALGAFAFTPEESMATLRHFYHEFGARLWGECGFYDAFCLEQDWFADSYLALDQGPIMIMIENHRTGLCWDMFMKNPEIEPMLKEIGWELEK